MPEYLEAWISMPGQGAESAIVASSKPNGYRLDHWRAGRVIVSCVGCFLYCHRRKIRLLWHNAGRSDHAESVVDFRIRGNFAGSILELRHMALPSVGEFLWHQRLWSASLSKLALLLRAA